MRNTLTVPATASGAATRPGEAGFIQSLVIGGIALMAAAAVAYTTLSHSANSSSADQNAKVQAATIISQGVAVKNVVDVYLTANWATTDLMFNGAPGPSVGQGGQAVLITDNTDPSYRKQIFNPSVSGGIAAPIPPSVAMANNTATDYWFYRTPGLVLTGVGSGGTDILMVLPDIKLAICQQINALVNNDSLTAVPYVTNVAAAGFETGASAITTVAAGGVPRSEGCLKSTDGVYVYYRALSIS
jgi:hypothetical protein